MARKKPAPEHATLEILSESYLAAIQMDGRSSGTAASYKADLALALKHFGAEKPVREITADEVAAYFDSDAVCKKRNGDPKNTISIAKTRRILRLALVWAVDSGWIDVAPLPAKLEIAAPAPTSAEPVPDEPTPGPGFNHPELAPDPAPVEAEKPRRGKKAKAVAAAE